MPPDYDTDSAMDIDPPQSSVGGSFTAGTAASQSAAASTTGAGTTTSGPASTSATATASASASEGGTQTAALGSRDGKFDCAFDQSGNIIPASASDDEGDEGFDGATLMQQIKSGISAKRMMGQMSHMSLDGSRRSTIRMRRSSGRLGGGGNGSGKSGNGVDKESRYTGK